MKKINLAAILVATIQVASFTYAQDAKVDLGTRNLPLPAADTVKTATTVEDEAVVNQRTREMLAKMDAAVREIAGFYGNPPFVRILTNDGRSAENFKERLSLSNKISDIRKELADLEKQRNEVTADLVLRRDTVKKLDEQILNTRATMDAIGKLVADSQKAIEESVNPKNVAVKAEASQPSANK